jgi:hypothetical protein
MFHLHSTKKIVFGTKILKFAYYAMRMMSFNLKLLTRRKYKQSSAIKSYHSPNLLVVVNKETIYLALLFQCGQLGIGNV